MALEQCVECGGQVSTSATECPHCGAQYPSPSGRIRQRRISRKFVLWIVVLLVVFLVLPLTWLALQTLGGHSSGNSSSIRAARSL